MLYLKWIKKVAFCKSCLRNHYFNTIKNRKWKNKKLKMFCLIVYLDYWLLPRAIIFKGYFGHNRPYKFAKYFCIKLSPGQKTNLWHAKLFKLPLAQFSSVQTYSDNDPTCSVPMPTVISQKIQSEPVRAGPSYLCGAPGFHFSKRKHTEMT